MNDENKLLKGASWYASQGWKLLKCYGISSDGSCTCHGTHTDPKDIGKHAALKEWQNLATDDQVTIENWWRAQPENNVAVNCSLSGFFVIDIDPRNGGFESFEIMMQRVNGEIPATVEAITGAYSDKKKKIARGRHLFFRCPPGVALKGRFTKEDNLPGIDIKHVGYVLLAPSRHQSGVEYEWKPGYAPWEMEMAEITEEMLEFLRDQRRSGRTSSDGIAGSYSTELGETDWSAFDGLSYKGQKFNIQEILEEGIEEGSRAVTVYALACALANKYGTDSMSQTFIETMMIRFNHEKISPPMELEGSNSLLMHVRRAIQFVDENPKHLRGNPELAEWQKRTAENMGKESFRSPGSSAPPVNTSDRDDDIEITSEPGTIGNAVEYGVKAGSSIMDASSFRNMDIPLDPDAISSDDGGNKKQRSLTDVGNGRRLVDSFVAGIRYTPVLGWHVWDGTHWRRDPENLQIRELSKKLSSMIASETIEYEDIDKKNEIISFSKQAKSAARMKSAIDNATSDTRIQVPVSQWDSNVELFGVANGVVNLRTGELMRGVPELHITRHSPVAYTPGLTHPRWQEFLDFATYGDKEYQAYLQRAVGYSMTGLNDLDIMFLIHGRPGSGKNTFIESFCKALGMSEYAYPMESTVLAQDDGRSTNTDSYHYAELRGKRVVWVDELPETERLKENAIKRLTGSATISARSPGEKPINFESQAKLWITTNHRPIITDDAMWRRMRALPWDRIPEKSDPTLKAFLSDPEIGLRVLLSWAVQGAVDFFASKELDPLAPETCTVVLNATNSYRSDEDRMAMFIREELVEAPGKITSVKKARTIYSWWSEERGERPMTQISFTRKLRDRGVHIEGVGSEAQIYGYEIKTKTPASLSGDDWSSLSQMAR